MYCESFDDSNSKRSTNSNAGQIHEKTFETKLDSTSLKKSNIETVCPFVPVCCEDSSKRILELEQKCASMEKYMKECSLKLEAENKMMKEKIVSLEKSVRVLENEKTEEKSKVKSEIQDSNRIKQNPDISNFSLEKSVRDLENEKIEQKSKIKSEIQDSYPRKQNPEISNCLGVFKLTLYTTERELKDEFSRFGPLEKVHLIRNELTGCSKGYGFVYFESVEDAKAAKEAMCDQKINGRQIRVEFSITFSSRASNWAPP